MKDNSNHASLSYPLEHCCTTFLSHRPHNAVLKSPQARPMQNAINDEKGRYNIALYYLFCRAQSCVPAWNWKYVSPKTSPKSTSDSKGIICKVHNFGSYFWCYLLDVAGRITYSYCVLDVSRKLCSVQAGLDAVTNKHQFLVIRQFCAVLRVTADRRQS